MNGLSRESRALLDAARHRDGLSAADKDRVRDKITRRLGAGLALGSAVTASATVAEAAHTTVVATVAAWLPGAAKVLGVVAIAGGVTVGAVRVSQRTTQNSAISASVPPTNSLGSGDRSTPRIAREIPQAVASSQAESLAEVSEPAPSPPSIRELPAVKRDSRVSNASSFSNETAPQPVAKPTDDGLSSQIAAIREARAALRRGDGRTAIAALDKGLPLGQGGPLEQEAIVARVSALCLLGEVSTARRTAEQFLARFPDSLLAPRIRNSCAYGNGNTP